MTYRQQKISIFIFMLFMLYLILYEYFSAIALNLQIVVGESKLRLQTGIRIHLFTNCIGIFMDTTKWSRVRSMEEIITPLSMEMAFLLWHFVVTGNIGLVSMVLRAIDFLSFLIENKSNALSKIIFQLVDSNGRKSGGM